MVRCIIVMMQDMFFAVGKKAAGTVKPTESTAEEKPATKPSSEATTVVNETKTKPVTKTVKSTRSVKTDMEKEKICQRLCHLRQSRKR